MILEKFKTKKYILVGVLADAKPERNIDQNYRFIYSYQQVPILMLQSDKEISSINPNPTNSTVKSESNGLIEALAYIGLSLLVIIVAILIYRKWIRNLIKRQKREHLSEQANG